MSNNRYWDVLCDFADGTRNVTDEMWKVWRWLAIGLAGFAVFDTTGQLEPLVFAIGVTTIGVCAATAWFFGGLINGLTEKGRSMGGFGKVFTTFMMFLLSLFFPLCIWVMLAKLALPIFVQT